MLGKLSAQQIERLASKPKVKRIAVENFLISIQNDTIKEAEGNLRLDASLYRWNTETINAIKEGIRLARDSAKKEAS
jgi:hypothetical protein